MFKPGDLVYVPQRTITPAGYPTVSRHPVYRVLRYFDSVGHEEYYITIRFKAIYIDYDYPASLFEIAPTEVLAQYTPLELLFL